MSWPPQAGKRRETPGGQPIRKGTRMLRQRTLSRGGNPGQPYAAVTDPRRIKPAKPEKRKRCGECFGPRSRYQSGLFCSRCEVELFGDRRLGYIHFIRSERARNVQRARRRAAA